MNKFSCGEQMVRETNRHNELRFSQVFRMLFLVMTVSHVFSEYGNILQVYEETYLKRRSFSFTLRYCIYFCLGLFSAVLFRGYSTLWFLFQGEGGVHLFQLSQFLEPFVIIAFFPPSMQLFFCFHSPVIPWMWWFSQCLQASTFTFSSFPAQQVFEIDEGEIISIHLLLQTCRELLKHIPVDVSGLVLEEQLKAEEWADGPLLDTPVRVILMICLLPYEYLSKPSATDRYT